jgi:acyl dehydratase
VTESICEFANWEEFAGASGTLIGYSPWLKVTQERVNLFADATDDHQWIHVDPERASSGPFGSPIAHGYLTLSLLPRFMNDTFVVHNLTMAVNYGLDKVRFPAPVPVGSRVRARIDFLEHREAKLGFLVALRFTVELEGTDKVACVADSLAIMVP